MRKKWKIKNIIIVLGMLLVVGGCLASTTVIAKWQNNSVTGKVYTKELIFQQEKKLSLAEKLVLYSRYNSISNEMDKDSDGKELWQILDRNSNASDKIFYEVNLLAEAGLLPVEADQMTPVIESLTDSITYVDQEGNYLTVWQVEVRLNERFLLILDLDVDDWKALEMYWMDQEPGAGGDELSQAQFYRETFYEKWGEYLGISVEESKYSEKTKNNLELAATDPEGEIVLYYEDEEQNEIEYIMSYEEDYLRFSVSSVRMQGEDSEDTGEYDLPAEEDSAY
nr:hypothetical protein [uncultured Mediterraneibacter sp.]